MTNSMHSLKYIAVLIGIFLCITTVVCAAQNPSSTGLTNVLAVHHSWQNTPHSIQITGTVVEDSAAPVPITIIATSEEEVQMQFGNLTRVWTPATQFTYDGKTLKMLPTPSGFAQLDLSSLFFLAHLPDRNATVGPPQTASVQGKAAVRMHINGGRSEMHYRQIPVTDEADLYVDGSSGLLTGIVRTFYQTAPTFQFTMALQFSDYKDTNGVLLPYKIDRFINGHNVESITVTSYALDVPAPAMLFAPPRRN